MTAESGRAVAADAEALQEVEILRIAAGGDGVGRWGDGRTVFVPRTAPGDRARVMCRASRRRHLSGTLEHLLSPGPGRVRPECAHYDGDGCGGCQLQHLDSPSQREAKRAIVGDALRRIGGLDVPDPELVPSETAWAYRNKLVLTVDRGHDRIGFHRYDAPGETFDLVRCAIAAPEVQAVWTLVRERRALLPRRTSRLVIRVGRGGATHLVAVLAGRRAATWPGAARLARHLATGGRPTTLWVWARGSAPVRMAGPDAQPGILAFGQVHPGLGDRVRRDAVDWLGSVRDRHVGDLYAGVGETSHLLATAGATVDAVERDRAAVDAGRRRCRGLPVRWHRGLVEDVVARHLDRTTHVILNPPRTGADRRVCEAILASGVERVVYISCDPATLARDLSRLLGAGEPRYRLGAVRAYDLFPQTAHVETVARLERR